MRSLAVIPLAGAVAFGVAGGVLLGVAAGNHARLTSPSAPPMDAETGRRVRDEGALTQALGAVGLAVGGAALVAGGAMLIFGGPRDPSTLVSVSPVPGGAARLVTGVLP